METIRQRTKDGKEYDHLFPKATGTAKIIKRDANVSHTVNFIPKVVRQTLYQTAQLAPELKEKTLYETCNKIWDFAHDHITYEKDAHGKEQVRSPRRTWADREHGVDCDCYATFISSILTNLRIPHTLRITKYKQDHFQHIYPIVPDGKGSYITLDCVVHEFDYEEPYSQKQDTKMDLEYLDGINDDESLFDDFQDEETGELGKLKIFKKIGTAVKKAMHVVNRVNPAIALLRTGLLAAMKINLMKIGGRIKWAYLSEEQAKQKGVIPEKYQQLKQVLSKVEQIFYGAGGKPENLKKAILTGRGNKDKAVLAGLGEIHIDDNMSEATPLSSLLGEDIYNSEMQGLEGLGEPVTAASIAAATGALTAIAALVKKIGDIFPKGDKKNEEAGEEGNPNEKVDVDDLEKSLPLAPNPASLAPRTAANTIPANGESSSPAATATAAAAVNESFWDKNKKWLKPTLIGAGGLTTLILAYKLINKNEKKPVQQPVSGIDGIKKKKRKRKGKDKITPIALM